MNPSNTGEELFRQSLKYRRRAFPEIGKNQHEKVPALPDYVVELAIEVPFICIPAIRLYQRHRVYAFLIACIVGFMDFSMVPGGEDLMMSWAERLGNGSAKRVC